MKTLYFFLTALVINLNLFSAGNEKSVKSKIDHVTVFLQGAQVFRSSPVSFTAGTSQIIFENLEAGINLHSLQAGGNGNFVILDVQGRTRYPDPAKIDKQDTKLLSAMRSLEDSITEAGYLMEDLANRRSVLTTEKQTILNNRLIRGETKKDTLALVKEAMDYLRSRLNNINSELLKIKREEAKLQKRIDGMNLRYAELQNFGNNPPKNRVPQVINYQVVVTIASEMAGSGNININYLLSNAGWSPSYDLRAKNTDSPMQLTYKANVYQNTGADWNDVKLKLSTGNPNQSSVKPVLSTWYIDYYVHRKKAKSSSYNKYELDSYEKQVETTSAPSMSMEDKEAMTSADFTSEVETFTNIEFDIKLPYSIPSDGTGHLVAVKNIDVPAGFVYFAVPKVDKDAFLVARITGWEDLNLIPAKANIFFEGTYVGQTYINPSTDKDTLDVTLGRDKNVVVTRTKLKEKTKEKILDNDILKSVCWEIVVKNARSNSVTVILEDQVPVSMRTDIIVETEDLSGGNHNSATGVVTWRHTVKPKESKKVKLAYSVKSPKSKPVVNF